MRLFCFAALLAVTTLSFAEEPARVIVVDKTQPKPTTTGVAAGGQPEKVTKVSCRREKPVGTQMVKRRCFTEAQLDIEREQARNVRIDP